MSKPSLQRLLEFQRLLLQFSQVERVTHRRDSQGRFLQENDTEHSYNLAMTGWYLAQYFSELDDNLIIRLAMVHDLVEVHAGDTYIYADPATLATKHEREKAALQKLAVDWKDFPEMTAAIKTYEERISPEARFVYALDKIMPIMLIYLHEGHTWQKENITAQKLDQVKRSKVAVSPEIEPYYSQLYELLESKPELFG